ncbi:glycosyltransferase [Dactylosporangium sp. NPDC005555]|uniref:glycosyltransferase n=1 Tax=Dactylosporangium sp. NPDC005555 TaxID=3154889 RepID=UPI0033A0993A
MRVLFVSAPLLGHVMPLVPLAEAFRRAGHDVLVATAADALTAGRTRKLPVVDVATGFSFDRIARRTMLRHPFIARAELAGTGGTRGVALLFGAVNEQLVDGVAAVADRFRPDLVVYEPLAVAGAVAAARRGIPAVRHENNLFDGAVLADVTAGPALRRHRVDALPDPVTAVQLAPAELVGERPGLPMRRLPVSSDTRTSAPLSYGRPGAGPPPRDLPGAGPLSHDRPGGGPLSHDRPGDGSQSRDQVGAGPLSHDRPGGGSPPRDRVGAGSLSRDPRGGGGEPVTPLPPAGGRPRIAVTRSTVDGPGSGGIMRAIVAVAPEVDADILLVRPERGLPDPLPGNVYTTGWLNLDALMPFLDAVVHHGGAGTVLGALAAGIPQLAVPGPGDRRHNAGVVERSGAGWSMSGAAITADQLHRLLSDYGLRMTAARFRDSMAARPHPDEVAAHLAAVIQHPSSPHA